MATWDEDIVAALENLGGSASYDDLYAEIERVRSELPATWKAVVRRRIQDLSSDSAGFKKGDDLFFSVEGLGAGVWGLRTHLKDTPEAVDLPTGNEEPIHVATQVYRILRDTALARQIKLLYRNRCQLCGQSILLSNGDSYSEQYSCVVPKSSCAV
jgi:hypothetical protein